MKAGGRLVKHARHYYRLLLAEGHLSRRCARRNAAGGCGRCLCPAGNADGPDKQRTRVAVQGTERCCPKTLWGRSGTARSGRFAAGAAAKSIELGSSAKTAASSVDRLSYPCQDDTKEILAIEGHALPAGGLRLSGERNLRSGKRVFLLQLGAPRVIVFGCLLSHFRAAAPLPGCTQLESRKP
jgi:hypothetical protein